MENLNLSPDQLKGILSLLESGKLQTLIEASSSSRNSSSHCNSTVIANSNESGGRQKETRRIEDTTIANRPDVLPEMTVSEGDSDSEEVVLEKDTVRSYTARELLEKAKRGTKATAQTTFRVSIIMK